MVLPSAAGDVGIDAVREGRLGDLVGARRVARRDEDVQQPGRLVEAALDPLALAGLRDAGAPPGVVELVEDQLGLVALEGAGRAGGVRGDRGALGEVVAGRLDGPRAC